MKIITEMIEFYFVKLQFMVVILKWFILYPFTNIQYLLSTLHTLYLFIDKEDIMTDLSLYLFSTYFFYISSLSTPFSRLFLLLLLNFNVFYILLDSSQLGLLSSIFFTSFMFIVLLLSSELLSLLSLLFLFYFIHYFYQLLFLFFVYSFLHSQGIIFSQQKCC